VKGAVKRKDQKKDGDVKYKREQVQR